MTLAADELNVTHSAVSRQIQHLEDVLGVPLFEGPKNKLRLTEAGSTLLSGLVSAFDQIDMSVRSVADTEDGSLDVSCPGTFTMRWLIPRLYRFQAEYPNIEVRLTASSRPVDFTRDGFDVAIRVGTAPWPQGAEVIALFPEQTGPVLSPSLEKTVAENFAGVPQLHTRTRLRAWGDWLSRSGAAGRDRNARGIRAFLFHAGGCERGPRCLRRAVALCDRRHPLRPPHRPTGFHRQRPSLRGAAARPAESKIGVVLRMAAEGSAGLLGLAPGPDGLERFSLLRNRRTAPSLCFFAIPDGKPLRTFPGIALDAAIVSQAYIVFSRPLYVPHLCPRIRSTKEKTAAIKIGAALMDEALRCAISDADEFGEIGEVDDDIPSTRC